MGSDSAICRAQDEVKVKVKSDVGRGKTLAWKVLVGGQGLGCLSYVQAWLVSNHGYCSQTLVDLPRPAAARHWRS